MVEAALPGRADELAALRVALLAPACRMLTLTGPPGVGKTRLAETLAAELADRFADGVAEVDLLGCASVEAAASLIDARLGTGFGSGRALHGTAQDRLVAHLRERTVLLVLDSCEALPEIGQLVTAVLAGSRRVKVLATSQQRLRLVSEREYAVPPLAMPAEPDPELGDRDDLDDLGPLALVPAMEVLLACTRQVRPGFALDHTNRRALVMICRQLEGLPLALQVAAARLTQFEPAEVAVRLRNRHRLLDAQLAPAGRHRSLRAALTWSHDLLGADERTVFRRVSVFPAAWSLAAAGAVVGEPDLDLLTSVETLHAKSLVRRVVQPDGDVTFDLLDSLRRFGRERLSGAGEEGAAEARFRVYYAGLAREVESRMGTPDETLSMAWSDHEFTNLRAALAGGIAAGDLETALPLAAATGWSWYIHGSLGEGAVVTSLVTTALHDRDRSDREDDLGGAVLVAGILSWALADREAAAWFLERARDLAESHAVVRRAAIAHAFLGHLARTSGRAGVAGREAAAARAAFAGLGNQRGVAWADHDLALVALGQGRLHQAGQLLGRALDHFEAEADAWACAWAWTGLAEVAVQGERWTEAASLLVRALEVYVALGDQPRVTFCAGLAARAAQGRGLAVQARDLSRPQPSDAVLALARAVGDPGAVPEIRLTPRQREVAVLVAGGATNRQIARRLEISERTVEVHLTQIMGRLGVDSRAQVAAHVVRARLDLPRQS